MLLFAGCAASSPPLPAARPEELPAAWLDAIARRPCPTPFEAQLRLRVDTPGRTPVTLDGRLEVARGALQLEARYGAFRPIFVLSADADTAQLLVHGERALWAEPRAATDDLRRGGPAAWARCLDWSLCTRNLLEGFRPDGPGTISGSDWVVSGSIAGTSLRMALRVDPNRGEIRSFELRDRDLPLLEGRLTRSHTFGAAFVPTRIQLRLIEPDTRMDVELTRLRPLETVRPRPSLPRGWHRAEALDLHPAEGAKRLPPRF